MSYVLCLDRGTVVADDGDSSGWGFGGGGSVVCDCDRGMTFSTTFCLAGGCCVVPELPKNDADREELSTILLDPFFMRNSPCHAGALRFLVPPRTSSRALGAIGFILLCTDLFTILWFFILFTVAFIAASLQLLAILDFFSEPEPV